MRKDKETIANGLAKIPSCESLQTVLRERRISLRIEQWIERADQIKNKEHGKYEDEPDSHHKRTGCVDIEGNHHDHTLQTDNEMTG